MAIQFKMGRRILTYYTERYYNKCTVLILSYILTIFLLFFYLFLITYFKINYCYCNNNIKVIHAIKYYLQICTVFIKYEMNLIILCISILEFCIHIYRKESF